jgi:hypothetical protein
LTRDWNEKDLEVASQVIIASEDTSKESSRLESQQNDFLVLSPGMSVKEVDVGCNTGELITNRDTTTTSRHVSVK